MLKLNYEVVSHLPCCASLPAGVRHCGQVHGACSNPLCRLSRWVSPLGGFKANGSPHVFISKLSVPDSTMSKSGTLKGFFKQKSAEKEKKELHRAVTIHRDDPFSSLQGDQGTLSPGDDRTLCEDGLLSSPKEKKSKRFLSLRLKKKKRKKEEDEGGEVFEELDSFSSRM